ncbi:GntR family transcriptional regulator [Salinicola peritrichatus]|uniref:GntR family transcriptional regulator n=1 Tax=Salinicola peritrichatus TaxID=1267424 RepID=UPI0013A60DD4|nr:FCD domain-containing protein [Salinicola peritrichatus]
MKTPNQHTKDNEAGEEAAGKTSTGVASVAARIEHLISSGELVGGDRINESALAQEFGTSRGPVREACRALEHAGLVRSVMNRGFFVQEIGLKEALDIYELRAALFRTAGRLLVERISQTELAALRHAVDAMDAAAEANDMHAFYTFNETFHTLIVEQCGNSKLVELWPRLQTQLNLFRRRSLVVRGALHDANAEHRSIVEALERGDATAATLLCERHVLSGKTRLLNTLTAPPLGTRHGRSAASIETLSAVQDPEKDDD